MWRFYDISTTISVPIFRVCRWFGSTTTDDLVSNCEGIPSHSARYTVYLHTVHGTQYIVTQCTVHSIPSHSARYTVYTHTVHSITSHSARYTVYPHTVHGTYALQVTVCSHNTDNVLTASAYLLLTKCVIFSWVLTVPPWWWFPCKPKHVEHFTYIRMF